MGRTRPDSFFCVFFSLVAPRGPRTPEASRRVGKGEGVGSISCAHILLSLCIGPVSKSRPVAAMSPKTDLMASRPRSAHTQRARNLRHGMDYSQTKTDKHKKGVW